MTEISLIAAMSPNRVIGLNNKMPWHMPAELQYFKKVTMGKPMIMGRKTFDAIGRRVLPGRKTIVLTRDKDLCGEDFSIAHSIDEALAIAGDVPEIMIIGGAKVYQEFLPLAKRIYLSVIDMEYAGDAFFPIINEEKWQVLSEEQHDGFCAKIYERELCIH